MKRIVLIGDVVSSRQISNRSQFQSRLKTCLDELNMEKSVQLISPYTITLGDEFQAVCKAADAIFHNAMFILKTVYPAKIRFSFGIGEITTLVNSKSAIGMDGPAFHYSRNGIDELKKKRSLFGISGLDTEMANMITPLLQLISHHIEKWKINRFEIFTLMNKGFSSQKIANRLELTDKAIYKNQSSGALHEIIQIFEEIENIMNKSLVN